MHCIYSYANRAQVSSQLKPVVNSYPFGQNLDRPYQVGSVESHQNHLKLPQTTPKRTTHLSPQVTHFDMDLPAIIRFISQVVYVRCANDFWVYSQLSLLIWGLSAYTLFLCVFGQLAKSASCHLFYNFTVLIVHFACSLLWVFWVHAVL